MIRGDDNIHKGFGITSFVLSLVGLFILISTIFISSIIWKLLISLFLIIIGIIGIILSIIQLKKGKTKLAIAGLIINIIILVLSIISIVAYFLLSFILSSFVESGTKDIDKVTDELLRNISN